MLLTMYDSSAEFLSDLIAASVLSEEAAPQFLKELNNEKVKIVFFDNEKGEFVCFALFRDIDETNDDNVIASISDAWAYYCNITDDNLLTFLRTGCLLTNAVFKGLKE